MIRTISYLFIYGAPIYYIAFYYPTLDVGMMLAVLASILLSGIVVGIRGRSKLLLGFYWVIGLGASYFLFRLGMGFFNVLGVLNWQFLTFKLSSYLLVSLVYFVGTALQLGYVFRKGAFNRGLGALGEE